jgi:hypothetical protein
MAQFSMRALLAIVLFAAIVLAILRIFGALAAYAALYISFGLMLLRAASQQRIWTWRFALVTCAMLTLFGEIYFLTKYIFVPAAP